MGVPADGENAGENDTWTNVRVWNCAAYPSPPSKSVINIKKDSTLAQLMTLLGEKLGYPTDAMEISIGTAKYKSGSAEDSKLLLELNFDGKKQIQISKVKDDTGSDFRRMNMSVQKIGEMSITSTPPSSTTTSSSSSSHDYFSHSNSNAGAIVPVGPVTSSGTFYGTSRDTSSSYSYGGMEWNKKSKTGFVGLSNQGATCYLNSLIQTLYMTPDFRNAVYRWNFEETYKKRRENEEKEKETKMEIDKPKEETEKPKTEEERKNQYEKDSIPRQLQLLFSRLQLRDQRAVKTKDLTNSFGWKDSDAFTQHDVQELCRVLFDALERVLKGTEQENLINDLYQGEMKDYVKCKECNTESSRTDKYLDIPLVIRGFGATSAVKSVEEALEKFVQPEVLENDNQYKCEKCNKKVDAIKGLKFTSFPYLLAMQLKRFDFDYDTLRRIKLNDRVTFPLLLDMNQFMDSNAMDVTSPSSEKPSKRKRVDDDSEDGIDEEEEDSGKKEDWETRVQSLLANGPYVYELYSVLIHRGSALGGHYYAYVKSFDTNKWYEFNDSSVSEINVEEITKVYGEEVDDKYRRPGMMSYYSSANAYMLMYRRIDPVKNKKALKNEEIPANLQERIVSENEKKKKKAEEKELEREMVKLKVLYQAEEKLVKVHNKKTMEEATKIVAEAFGIAAKYPPECYRLRNYQVYNDLPSEPFDTPDVLSKPLVEFHWYTSKTIMLETRKPDETFPEYNPSDMQIRVIRYDQDNNKFLEPIIVYINRLATLGDLKKLLAPKLGIPAQHQRVVREFLGYNGPPAKILTGDEGSLQSDHRVYESSKVYVEYCTDQESDSPSFAEIDRTRNMLAIKYNLPGKDDADQSIQVSKKMTFKEFKELIQPIIKLPIDEFRVLRGGATWKTEIKSDSESLDECRMVDGCRLFIEKGKPLKEGESCVKFVLFDAENKRTKDYVMELFELNVDERMTMTALKENISTKLKEEKQIEISPQHLRVREIYSTGPAKVYRSVGSGTIKESSFYIYTGKTMAVQELTEPDPVITDKEVVFFLQQWFPSKYEFGPKIELILSENMTIPELKQMLSTKYNIQNVGIAKPNSSWPGPDPLEVPELDWDRKIPEFSYSSSMAKGAIGSVPLFMHDGDILIFRDNDEPLKELSKEEKRKYEKEAQVRKRPTYHHKEEALTINAKV